MQAFNYALDETSWMGPEKVEKGSEGSSLPRSPAPKVSVPNRVIRIRMSAAYVISG